MQKEHLPQGSPGYYPTNTVPSNTQYTSLSSRQSNPQIYYTNVHTALQSQNMQSGYPSGGPVQQPLPAQQQYQQISTPMPIRASSGAWNPAEDQTLMAARAQGMNWAPIQQAYFPTKTPNACRKRHERLMERRSADDWDAIKLENLAKTYIGMRREIWSGLAAQTGEKWNVVEQKCMTQGLKNLQAHARSGARRERLLDAGGAGGMGGGGAYGDSHTDDSGIGIEDLEAEYDADGASDNSSGGGGGGGGGMVQQQYHQQRAQYHQQRLPSMDMGIDAIINRPGNRRE